jgi:hypothetical protein
MAWHDRGNEPSVDPAIIEAAVADDPIAARAEYFAEFRSDVETFVATEVIDACVALGRHELPYYSEHNYSAFCDPSGGSADAMTIAIAHREGDVGVLDVLREVRPPFSPESVVKDFANLLGNYEIRTVEGDRYGGEWPRERFREHGIEYLPAEKSKSDLYREALPLLNSRRVELLDHGRMLAQLAGLERRTARGGRDSIDHMPGGHDDLINSAAGVLVRVAGEMHYRTIWERL